MRMNPHNTKSLTVEPQKGATGNSGAIGSPLPTVRTVVSHPSCGGTLTLNYVDTSYRAGLITVHPQSCMCRSCASHPHGYAITYSRKVGA